MIEILFLIGLFLLGDGLFANTDEVNNLVRRERLMASFACLSAAVVLSLLPPLITLHFHDEVTAEVGLTTTTPTTVVVQSCMGLIERDARYTAFMGESVRFKFDAPCGELNANHWRALDAVYHNLSGEPMPRFEAVSRMGSPPVVATLNDTGKP